MYGVVVVVLSVAELFVVLPPFGWNVIVLVDDEEVDLASVFLPLIVIESYT